MLRRCLRFCRSHPVIVAALIGAVLGTGNAIAIEIGALAHKNSAGVLPLFWSSSASRAGQLNAAQTTTLLVIEFAGNMLSFAILFALPTALFVGVRRIFSGRSRSSVDSQAGQINEPDRQ
jgi:hypothetical protein